MDRFTIRNLELYHGYNPNAVTLDVIDKTLSPMGGRLLKRWLHPIRSTKIKNRHQVVTYLIENQEFCIRCKIKLNKYPI
jgi:DNA mismatch repair protein MutS